MNELRILVTGYRTTTQTQDFYVMHTLRRICAPALANGLPVTIVQGECPYGGVDAAARRWAEETDGVTNEGHPAPWHMGKTAGRIRNAHMVSLGAAICIGFPSAGSVGTWDCIRKAADALIACRIYPLPVELHQEGVLWSDSQLC